MKRWGRRRVQGRKDVGEGSCGWDGVARWETWGEDSD